MKLTDANKIRDYVKAEINPYGKPFDGSVYEFGLKIMHYIDNMSADYDIDKVVEELDKASYLVPPKNKGHYADNAIDLEDAIEIVKQDGVVDDVCEWKIDGVYLHSPHNKPFVTCIANDEDYRYHFCPVCGKKIKAVE